MSLEWIELKLNPEDEDEDEDETDQRSPATEALNKLSTTIASCNTLAEHVRELREVASGATPESLAKAFKKTCPFLTLTPNGDTCAQIVSLMLRQQFHAWVGKSREKPLKLADYCDPRDPSSLKRGENRIRSIEFIASIPQAGLPQAGLPHYCDDWLRVALLSDTQMTGDEELTEKSKQAKTLEYSKLNNELMQLLYKVSFPKTNELQLLRVELDKFDRDAAYVGLQAIVCYVKDTFPTLKLSEDADLAKILDALKAYNERGGRIAEKTPGAFWPEAILVRKFFDAINAGKSIKAYITHIKSTSTNIPGLGPESVCKMLKLNNPNYRIPPRISTSYENIFSYLLRIDLLQQLSTKDPLKLKNGSQMPDLLTHWHGDFSKRRNRSDWITLIVNAEPDCKWATAALLSDKQLIGEEMVALHSQRHIKDKLNQLRKSLCRLMPEVLDPNKAHSADLLNRIDQFDQDAANFGLQWMVARIKTRHPEIELHETAEASEILAAVRRHYERTPQKQRQPEKALLEALRDTIRSRAKFKDCIAVLIQGLKNLKGVTHETLLQQFELDYPRLRPRFENLADIVSLMLRHELSLEFQGQGPTANEWQNSNRCRLSEPLFSEGRDQSRSLFSLTISTLEPRNEWLIMAMPSNTQLTGEDEYKGHETTQALKKKMQELRKEKAELIPRILESQPHSTYDLPKRMDNFDRDANGVGFQWIIEAIKEKFPDIDLPMFSNTQQILDTVHRFHAIRLPAETSTALQPGRLGT